MKKTTFVIISIVLLSVLATNNASALSNSVNNVTCNELRYQYGPVCDLTTCYWYGMGTYRGGSPLISFNYISYAWQSWLPSGTYDIIILWWDGKGSFWFFKPSGTTFFTRTPSVNTTMYLEYTAFKCCSLRFAGYLKQAVPPSGHNLWMGIDTNGNGVIDPSTTTWTQVTFDR